jgi:dTDP-glucose 4,6-dehydratase
MRILVTGGLGFIGSNFVEEALKHKHSIVNIDKAVYKDFFNVNDKFSKNPNYNFVKRDIAISSELHSILEKFKPNALVHFAAESHVDTSIKTPNKFLKSNIIGTFNLLESVKNWIKQDGKIKKSFLFFHISTDEVFGDLSFGSKKSFDEGYRYDPSSPYSASKASSDMLVNAWSKTYGIRSIISNCSNNYGPNQFPEKLIPKTIKLALSGQKIPLYGSGNNQRDWLHVSDHVNFILKALKKKEVHGMFNVGTGKTISNKYLVTSICKILDKKIKDKPYGIKTFVSLIEYVDDRLGHDRVYRVNPSKSESQLGWTAKVKLEDGLEGVIDWYIKRFKA